MHNQSTLGRYEYKYSISPDMMAAVRMLIRPYCRMDHSGTADQDGFYVVRSLYFDDDRYSLYRDTEDQVPVRIKLRARTYGDSNRASVKLEVKKRTDELIVKSSHSVPQENWMEGLVPCHNGNQPWVGPARTTASNVFVARTRLLGARPKMLVRYERQAFQSTIDDYVRITFDRNIVHQPMSAYDLAGRPDRWAPTGDRESAGHGDFPVVLEFKFVERAPQWLVDIVRKCGLFRGGFSKYANAVRKSLVESNVYWSLAPVWAFSQAGRETRWAH